MNLDRVTITGADNSINPDDLIPLTDRFPFIEWGILLSQKSEGKPRYPTRDWISFLGSIKTYRKARGMSLSGHICGRWAKDIGNGVWSIANDLREILVEQDVRIFDRMQLNLGKELYDLPNEGNPFLIGIKNYTRSHPWGDISPIKYIFQVNERNDISDSLLERAKNLGLIASPLYDGSGGGGILPKKWPPNNGQYCGYAGGLSPENIVEQLESIKKVAGNAPIWIDVESKVRSDDDSRFDLDKVARFLEATEPYIAKSHKA